MGVSVRLDRRRVESGTAEEIEDFSQQSTSRGASTPSPENCLTLPASQHQVADQSRHAASPGCRRLSESLQKLGDRRDPVEEDDHFADPTQAGPMSAAAYACHWSRFLNRSPARPEATEVRQALMTDPAIPQQSTSHGSCGDQEAKPSQVVLLVDSQPGVSVDSPSKRGTHLSDVATPGQWAVPSVSSTAQAELEALNAAADNLDSVNLICSPDDVPLAQPSPPLPGDDIDDFPGSAGSIQGTEDLDPGHLVEAASLIFVREVVTRAVCHGGSNVSVEILRKALCESWDLDLHDAYHPDTKARKGDRTQALVASRLEAKRSRKRSCSQSASVSTPKQRSKR